MAELEALGDEKVRAWNSKSGAGENQFGVKMGDIRGVAKKIKTDPELARQLWETGNLEARLLAVLILKPQELSADELERMVRSVDYAWLADWLNNYVVKNHPNKEELRERWMAEEPANGPGAAAASRAGWSLTTERVVKNPDGLDMGALLDRIEREMKDAPELARWNMNFCLGEIGINHPAHRERVVAIGQKIGAYRDYPVSKGCIPPYVPVWVAEIVKRQG